MINILFTADQNYAVRIPPVVKSVRINHPDMPFGVHLIGSGIPGDLERELAAFCEKNACSFHMYHVPETLFDDAPVNKHYSKAMYYRMLAPEILPETVERIIYLDPDVLVINSLQPLWELDLENCLFAAASHLKEEGLVEGINRVRLDTASIYYNTGVLLMDLKAFRKASSDRDVFSKIEKYAKKLLLPDQDVFNTLYGHMTKPVDDEIWNYDVRKYSRYLLKSGGERDTYWVIRNTAVLHYCGKGKPWSLKYRYRFGDLYRHYEQLCALDGWTIGQKKKREVPLL